jgi:hypothetical protein
VDRVGGEPVAAVAGIAVASPPGLKAARWALHFAEEEVVVLGCDPPLAAADVLARHPTALAAEPLSAPAPEELPPEVATMFAECVAAGLYGEEEAPVLRSMHASDPGGARAMVETMHARIGRCYGCRHFARPGLSDGYCGARTDLPHAYGLLHVLPPGKGATCDQFTEG